MGQHLLSSTINKKKRTHGKYSVEIHNEVCWFQYKLVQAKTLIVVIALLRFDIVKNSICIVVSFLLVLQTFLFFSLIHLALIPDWLDRLVGAESWVIVCFVLFRSICTNFRSITCIVRQSCCYYFCCLVICCLYFSIKKYSLVLFKKSWKWVLNSYC